MTSSKYCLADILPETRRQQMDELNACKCTLEETEKDRDDMKVKVSDLASLVERSAAFFGIPVLPDLICITVISVVCFSIEIDFRITVYQHNKTSHLPSTMSNSIDRQSWGSKLLRWGIRKIMLLHHDTRNKNGSPPSLSVLPLHNL